MATLRLKLKGQDHSQFVKGEDNGFELYQLEQAFTVTNPTRGDVPEQILEIDENKIIEFEFDDDSVWIGDKETLREIFPSEFKRSGEIDELYLPEEISSGESDRGIFKKVGIKLLKIFVKKKVIKPKMRELGTKLENKQLAFSGNDFEKVGYGILCHCDEEFELREAKDLKADQRHLLFLHGTGSSTKSSFGDLKESEEYKKLVGDYGAGRILAFQHRSLTTSPLENVLDLVDQLPDGIELDLISQSRGGLVADILVRFCSDKNGFGKDELEVLKDYDRERDLEVIKEISSLLSGKNITIRKQVRVASPANGTTLASKRLNIFLNVTFNLIGLASGQVGNPIFVAFKEMILEAVACKDDVDVLPGLEAMNPQSPFIKVLNYQGADITIETPLFVVGGSSELSLKFKSLVVLIGKFFFLDKNDLVVDTESMKWGAKRKPGNVSLYIEKSGQIDHFKYFSTENTLHAVIDALESEVGKIPEAFTLQVTTHGSERGIAGIEGGAYKQEEISGNRPIVILLPGIMGSNLKDSKLVWINYLRFLKGGLTKLAYQGGMPEKIIADSLIATSYEDLGDHLKETYDVVTFQFDWRLPLQVSAIALEEKIKECLDHGQPIKIVAHSMGGVLVRDFILYHSETWKLLNESKGFKAVFLGSPLGGSYRIPYVLFGKDSIIRLLGKIDIKHSTKQLLEVFSDFPGILNLLPIGKENKYDFSDRKVWEDLRTAFGDESWPIPSKKVLEEFGKHQELVLKGADSIDYKNICYIAGQSRKKKFTVCDLEIEDGELVFYGTNSGDESVTWKSGIPKGILNLNQLYYANVTHGGLSKDKKLFAAINELLSDGFTKKLQNGLPSIRGEEKDFVAEELEPYDISEENVVNTILGTDQGEDNKWTVEAPIRVNVSHGNLKYAKYPVVAGHFQYDAILTSESVIDKQLKGELSRLLRLGLYPGPIGTNQVVLAEENLGNNFQGAIIVGLGIPGELSAFQLMTSIEKGVSRFLTLRNQCKNNASSNQDLVGVSVISIANAYGGLSTDSSIRAIIQGIQRANRNIQLYYEEKIKGVEEIEIIELFDDKALSLLKSVQRLQTSESKEFNIVYQGKGLSSKLGKMWRIPYDNSSDWWTRISVSELEEEGEEKFKMSVATSGASEKVAHVSSNNEILKTLLKDMTLNNQRSPEIAKTMFELLVPLNFKEELKRQNNITWVLDVASAEYPWEMIQENVDSVPLCIHSGMVRQLATGNFRDKTSRVNEKTALVIGDPILEKFFSQLPGAKKEAEMVTALLKGEGYTTESLINTTATSIFLKLFAKNHKIIHLAGHGVFNYGPQKATGMVIGNNSFLTPGQLAGMSETAELVFVNCCYLGQMDKESELKSQQRNKFAANIGTQLINNGARAVIVAGWAVDDTAALDFSRHFYQNMFSGLGFGEAVKRARKKIYDDHKSRTNTWGAFQCYGDPFYRLVEGGSNDSNENGVVILEEVELELRNLAQQMDTNDYDPESVLKRMIFIEESVEKMNLKSEKILELGASIFNGLNEYSRSVECYEKLFASGNSNYSVKSIEQYGNVSAKLAVQKYVERNLSESEAVKAMDKIINELTLLNQLLPTSERLSLLGSTYKRKMFIQSPNSPKQALKSLSEAIHCYERASKISDFKNPYPLINWLSLLRIKMLLEGKTSITNISLDARKVLEQLFEKSSKDKGKADTFWKFANTVSIRLTQYILGTPKVTLDELIDLYKGLWTMAGNKGQKVAELEHLDILSAGLSQGTSKAIEDLRLGIETLKKKLEKNI